MKRNKKKNIKLFILVLLLFIGIGFAALAANLKIDGTVSVTKVAWNVHFENVEVTEGSVEANPAPTSDDATTKEMNYSVHFTKPGEFYEFTVYMKNSGTMNAMLNLVSNKVYESDGKTERQLPDYLTSSVTYIDGTPIVKNQILKAGTREKIKVRIEYRTDIDPEDLPKTPDALELSLSEDYKQADENAVPVRNEVDFEEDGWDKIILSYDNEQLDPLQEAMENGTLREVQLDMDNDGTPETTSYLRIANLTTPDVCKTQGFSQTACGLVLEFPEIIATHTYTVSQSSSADTSNVGGWGNSLLREYMNTVIYNALPSDIKSRVKDTTVVSGHGSSESANFVTTDKLFLFTLREVWGDTGSNVHLEKDTASDYTRQLDYYKAQGVTWDDTTYALVKKKYNGNYYFWWFRSAYATDRQMFNCSEVEGQPAGTYPGVVNGGVSPAFRIG